jgi:glycosyltransferase domain-containing protein
MIAILMLTYNRPEFLQRAFSYYKNKSELLQDTIFHIYDASDEAHFLSNLGILSKLKGYLHINHVRYGGKKSEYQRLYDSTINIEEEYVLLVADDDFIIVESLKPTKDFLDNNLNYVACSGLKCSFVIENPDVKEVKGDKIRIIGGVPGPFWPIDDPIGRFSTYMRTGIPMLHFLMRNQTHKNIYSHLNDERFVAGMISQDLLPCVLLAIDGNIKRLDSLLSFVKQENKFSNYQYLDEMVEDVSFAPTLSVAKKLLVEKLSGNGHSLEETQYIVNREFAARFSQLFGWLCEHKYEGLTADFAKFIEEQGKKQYVMGTKEYYSSINQEINNICTRMST